MCFFVAIVLLVKVQAVHTPHTVCFHVSVNICRVYILFAFSSKRFKNCRSKVSCFGSNQASLREATYSTKSFFNKLGLQVSHSMPY